MLRCFQKLGNRFKLTNTHKFSFQTFKTFNVEKFPIRKTYFSTSKDSGIQERELNLKNESQVNQPQQIFSRKEYFQMFNKITKSRLSAMNALMVSLGYLAVDLNFVNSGLIFGTSFMTSCVLQAMGQVYEVDKDSEMKRTSNRPIVTGQINPRTVSMLSLFTYLT